MRRRRPFQDDPTRPPPIPWEYAGQWVAVDQDSNEILASGHTLAEAIANADKAGFKDYILERGPSKDGAAFVGAA